WQREVSSTDSTSACAGDDGTDAAHQEPHGPMACHAGGHRGGPSCHQGRQPNASSTACDVSSSTCCGPGPGCRNCTTTFANGSGGCTINASTPNGSCTVTTCAAGFHVDSASNSCAAKTDTSSGSP